MYYATITPQVKSLIQNTSLALLSSGRTIKPSEIKTFINSTLPIQVIQNLIDELYNEDVLIRRQITTEGTHITYTYSKLSDTPKKVVPKLKFGYVSDLDLSKYNQNLYVAYHKDSPAALFNTGDKYKARTMYKALVGPSVKHNDVRMVKLSSFLKK